MSTPLLLMLQFYLFYADLLFWVLCFISYSLVNKDIIWWPCTTEKFTVNPQLNCNVGVLRLFPGITDETVRPCGYVCLYLPHIFWKFQMFKWDSFSHQVKAFLQPPMAGVILETFGSGNAPDRKSLMDIIRQASVRGIIMINCTQCLRGSVTSAYATGQVWGFD